MKTKIGKLFLLSISLVLVLSYNTAAKSAVYDILAKGSEWTLNVDGETGIMKLLGGTGSRTNDGGWEMTSEIDWQGNPGSLSAQADGNNAVQKVSLHVLRKNGLTIACEGYIAQETDRFMAGFTLLRARPADIHGAWYATKRDSEKDPSLLLNTGRLTAAERERKPVRIRETKPDFKAADNEAPKVYIKVEGILVFTVNDTIQVRATAEDNTKIARIDVYIDDQVVKTCEAWECRYSEILTQPGKHRCSATAEDTSGNRGTSEVVEFMVHPTSNPGPSLNLKIQPYHPSERDRIKFIAQAQHSSGVESITIFVNGLEATTCPSSVCEYTGGPYNTDQITWRVSAKSRDGGITYGTDNTVDIARSQSAAGSGSISGKVYGSGAGAAGVFHINLYGPDDLNKFRTTARFDRSGNYIFTGLPAGQYKLVVDTKADTAIGPIPSYRVVRCSGGAVTGIDFELK